MSIVASHITSTQEFDWSKLLAGKPPTQMDPFPFSFQPTSQEYDCEDMQEYDSEDIQEYNYESTMQTTSLSISTAPSHHRPFCTVDFPFAASGKSFEPKYKESHLPIPFSFPRPDASCFIANYAPSEPLILLPNNFIASGSLNNIVTSLEEYFSDGNITFTSSGSSWSGVCISEYGVRCTFRICVYKSRKFPGEHVVEVQRTGGDGFVFGNFYDNLKKVLRS